MAHEHGVAAVGIERAPGLVRDRDVTERAAALEHERPVARRATEIAVHQGDRPAAMRPMQAASRDGPGGSPLHDALPLRAVLRSIAPHRARKAGPPPLEDSSSVLPYATAHRPACIEDPARRHAPRRLRATRPSSAGSGTSSTWRADSLIASGLSAAPGVVTQRPGAHRRRRQHRRDPPQIGRRRRAPRSPASTEPTSPSRSTAASRTLVCVASTTLGTSRCRTHRSSEPVSVGRVDPRMREPPSAEPGRALTPEDPSRHRSARS